MSKILELIFILSFLIGNSNPETILNTYLDAKTIFNCETIYQLSSVNQQRQIPLEEYSKRCQKGDDLTFRFIMSKSKFEIQDLRIDGLSATAEVKLSLPEMSMFLVDVVAKLKDKSLDHSKLDSIYNSNYDAENQTYFSKSSTYKLVKEDGEWKVDMPLINP